ncbi:MAG: parvulin-like peptidyl-prolyl isomerase [Paraglaciecola sp.]|jgi:parvulin-like peptidyl-prolyl isomerase
MSILPINTLPRKISLGLSSLLFLTLNGCSEVKEPVVTDNAVVASVGERNITAKALADELLARSGGLNQHPLSEQQKRQVLDEMIQRQVQITAAHEAGFANDPAIIAALENLMINKLHTEQLSSLLDQVSISQAEIELYYQQNLQNYTTAAMTRFALIRLSLSPQASADKRAAVKAQAEQVYQLALTQPATVNGFGSLAAKYSDHQASRYAGGDFGWIKNGVENKQIDPAIVIALNKLKQNGDLAPLVKGHSAYYLIKRLDSKAEKETSLERVGSNIQRLLEQESRKQAEAQWLLALQNQGQEVVVNQDVLLATSLPMASSEPSKQDTPPRLPSK